jgi:hypothetical protein
MPATTKNTNCAKKDRFKLFPIFRTFGGYFLPMCSAAFRQARGANPAEDLNKSKKEQPAKQAVIANPQSIPPFEPPFVPAPPVIDGALDDAAWKSEPLALSEWINYNPAYGEIMAQKTKVWVAYDKTYLYFAFRCLDPEPDKIKSAMSRRDTIWNDDWIGLSLDSLGSGQSSYDLFVNPHGIQGDILNTRTGIRSTSVLPCGPSPNTTVPEDAS